MTDVFGRMVRDYHRDDLTETPTDRRDDGETSDAHLGHYFTAYDEWSSLDRSAVNAVASGDGSSVVDLGCGVGCTALHLQSAEHDVSRGAVAVARARGVEQVAVMELFSLGATGPFDAALVVGQQWCAAGTRARFRKVLCELAGRQIRWPPRRRRGRPY